MMHENSGKFARSYFIGKTAPGAGVKYNHASKWLKNKTAAKATA
jgi:hypothetical protein